MKQPKIQSFNRTKPKKNWLYAKGWKIRQAARFTGYSWSHIAAVLRGERLSTKLLNVLEALPEKDLDDPIPVSGK